MCLKRQFFTAGVTFQLQTHLEMRPAYVHLKLRLFGVIPGDLLDPGLPERLFPIRSLLYGSFSLTCLNFGGCAQCVRNLQIDQLHFADQRVQVLLDARDVLQDAGVAGVSTCGEGCQRTLGITRGSSQRLKLLYGSCSNYTQRQRCRAHFAAAFLATCARYVRSISEIILSLNSLVSGQFSPATAR